METKNQIISILILFAVPILSYNGSAIITPVEKMIIDTDSGGDDAVAIIMSTEAERSNGNPKIIAITCVNGNTHVDTVALNVLKTLKIVDRLDIPVYKGASHPLLLLDEKDNYFGKDGYGDFDYPDPPSTSLIKHEFAAVAMIKLVKKHPGKITLLALGPLTNIGLAIRLYPAFLDQLQQLIVMGGSVAGRTTKKPGTSFNFLADPGAAFIVFNSSTSKPVSVVPEDTTNRFCASLDINKSPSKSTNGKAWLVQSIAAMHSNPNEQWHCADSITASVALTSGSIVTNSATYYLEAIYEGAKTTGMSIIDYANVTGNPANANFIYSIDVIEHGQLLSKYIN